MALFTLHHSTDVPSQDTVELSTDGLRGIIHSASKVGFSVHMTVTSFVIVGVCFPSCY